jgi:hypothetical protein
MKWRDASSAKIFNWHHHNDSGCLIEISILITCSLPNTAIPEVPVSGLAGRVKPVKMAWTVAWING